MNQKRKIQRRIRERNENKRNGTRTMERRMKSNERNENIKHRNGREMTLAKRENCKSSKTQTEVQREKKEKKK
jgi:hypothetical protein